MTIGNAAGFQSNFVAPAGTSTTSKYIGVPEGYTTTRYLDRSEMIDPMAFDPYSPEGPGIPVTGVGNYPTSPYEYTYRQQYTYQPQYVNGAQWEYASRPMQDIAAMQNRLAEAGLLSQFSPGVWDDYSANAMERLMGIANTYGFKYDDILNRMIAGGGVQKYGGKTSGGSGGLAAPQMTDDDIRAVANKVAQGVLGRNLREDEVTGFIPAFRSSIAGGTSASTAGETIVRQQVAPVEAGGYGIGGAMQVINQMLSGGATSSMGGG